ncbi:helix-turn-helix domain-containing protein [Singulisphaera sp. PoT]|uniref:helix-turn-helix domain-containing protein n=1 Tax=Singulisphaera sp. PoT TaxID=3411797 RepID=UPI003BF48D35
MSLAQRVRDYRYSKGWGPDELASRAAISRTALYQIESGKTELPRAGTLRRIALALDVSMETLLGHGDGSLPVDGTAANAGRKSKTNGEWLPSEGGPLAIPVAARTSSATIESIEGARFAVEAPTLNTMSADGLVPQRERDLAWKLHELLASPLGEGVARIIEETYRLLPQARRLS